jgi:pyrimidine operon attenuation protein/uracil phosphoribosyltransferase
MSTEKTLILNTGQINQKLKRMAYQIFEQHHNEKELVMVAIEPKGLQLANKLLPLLRDISGADVKLYSLTLDKKSPLGEIVCSDASARFDGKSVLLVDDVLNSGRTLMYAARYILSHPVARLTTAVLVDRQHRQFPIRADFVGLSLSTTLQDHINVQFKETGEAVYLE